MRRATSPVILFVLVTFLAISCSRAQKADETISEQAPAPSTSELKNRPAPSEKTPASTQVAGNTPPERTSVELISNSREEASIRLLSYQQGSRFVPEDFVIGLLQDWWEENQHVRAVVPVVEKFLGAFVRGTVSETLLLPEKREYLSRTLNYHIQQGDVPEEYRIGSITLEQNQTAVATLRFFAQFGSATGDIYLTKAGNRWYISDIQTGFQWVPKIQDQTVFFPYSHRDMYIRR